MEWFYLYLLGWRCTMVCEWFRLGSSAPSPLPCTHTHARTRTRTHTTLSMQAFFLTKCYSSCILALVESIAQ